MSHLRLDWQSLLPKFGHYSPLFKQAERVAPLDFIDLQPRLAATLDLFCRQQRHPAKLMLLKGVEDRRYLSLLADAIATRLPHSTKIVGSCYQIQENSVSCTPATTLEDNFATMPRCIFEDWAEQATLLGSLCGHPGSYRLQPGLVHQANQGILVMPLQVVLEQPWLWPRLKQVLVSGEFHWYPADESRPLPLAIPPMPLDLRLVLVGDDFNLLEFAELELTSHLFSIYSELEPEYHVTNIEEMRRWMGYVGWIADRAGLPALSSEVWPALLRAAVRHTEDHQRLPLCPLWLENLLAEAVLIAETEPLCAKHLQTALQMRRWRESYLPELVMGDIDHGQVRIETQGSAVGQLNGLAVVTYPGHTLSFGEPSRISCVVHLGDGDFTDVERKAELGGNIHAKGMLIMQAYLVSELALEQPFPFSASLVFEQSYSEVDGDSASLAGLCALVSALSQQPLSQKIAVTGAVDQFGRVQSVGGLNEKVEGFFAICAKRGLSGDQGVILPAANLRHLCLSDDVVQAVRNHHFHIWTVEHAADALPLLTGLPYRHQHDISLLGLITERIAQLNAAQGRQRLPLLLRWLTWFSRG